MLKTVVVQSSHLRAGGGQEGPGDGDCRCACLPTGTGHGHERDGAPRGALLLRRAAQRGERLDLHGAAHGGGRGYLQGSKALALARVAREDGQLPSHALLGTRWRHRSERRTYRQTRRRSPRRCRGSFHLPPQVELLNKVRVQQILLRSLRGGAGCGDLGWLEHAPLSSVGLTTCAQEGARHRRRWNAWNAVLRPFGAPQNRTRSKW